MHRSMGHDLKPIMVADNQLQIPLNHIPDYFILQRRVLCASEDNQSFVEVF